MISLSLDMSEQLIVPIPDYSPFMEILEYFFIHAPIARHTGMNQKFSVHGEANCHAKKTVTKRKSKEKICLGEMLLHDFWQ